MEQIPEAPAEESDGNVEATGEAVHLVEESVYADGILGE